MTSNLNTALNHSQQIAACHLISMFPIDGAYYNGAADTGSFAILTLPLGQVSIDGVVPQLGDRIILNAQTDSAQNGIYEYQTAYDGATVAGVFQRAPDFQGHTQLSDGAYVVVTAGETYTGTVWVLTSVPSTVGHDALVFTNSSAAATMGGGGNQNIILGGDFGTNPFQRGNSFVDVANGQYVADGFFVNAAGIQDSTEIDIDQASVVLPSFSVATCKTSAYLRILFNTPIPSSASNYFLISQAVEGYRFGNIGTGAFTVSFCVRASIAGTYCISLSNTVNKTYLAEYTISTPNSWERKIIHVTGIPNASVFNFDDGLGIQINFASVVGTDFQNQTVNEWLDGIYYATPNQVDGTADGAEMDYACIQIEPGTTATSFNIDTPENVFEQAARYYQKSYENTVGTGTVTDTGAQYFYIGTALSNGDRIGTFNFPYEMRGTPTVAIYSPATGTASKIREHIGADDLSAASSDVNSKNFLVRISQDVADTSLLLSYHFGADSSF